MKDLLLPLNVFVDQIFGLKKQYVMHANRWNPCKELRSVVTGLPSAWTRDLWIGQSMSREYVSYLELAICGPPQNVIYMQNQAR